MLFNPINDRKNVINSNWFLFHLKHSNFLAPNMLTDQILSLSFLIVEFFLDHLAPCPLSVSPLSPAVRNIPQKAPSAKEAKEVLDAIPRSPPDHRRPYRQFTVNSHSLNFSVFKWIKVKLCNSDVKTKHEHWTRRNRRITGPDSRRRMGCSSVAIQLVALAGQRSRSAALPGRLKRVKQPNNCKRHSASFESAEWTTEACNVVRKSQPNWRMKESDNWSRRMFFTNNLIQQHTHLQVAASILFVEPHTRSQVFNLKESLFHSWWSSF